MPSTVRWKFFSYDMIAYVAYVIYPPQATPGKQLWDPSHLCSWPHIRTQRITRSALRICRQPDWHVDNGYFNRPIMGRIIKSWLIAACSRLRDSRVRRTEKARTRKQLSLMRHPYCLRAWKRVDSTPVVSHNLWHAGCDDEKEESALCSRRARYELRRLQTSQTQILVRKAGSQHGLNQMFNFVCGTGYNDLSTYHFPQ